MESKPPFRLIKAYKSKDAAQESELQALFGYSFKHIVEYIKEQSALKFDAKTLKAYLIKEGILRDKMGNETAHYIRHQEADDAYFCSQQQGGSLRFTQALADAVLSTSDTKDGFGRYLEERQKAAQGMLDL